MYDVVVSGARCAGASLAMLLGRAGLDVLVLDRDTLPSDKITSTHFLWHEGAACLKRWGLLDRLEATGCPMQRNFRLDMGELKLDSTVELRGCSADGAIAPRRSVLDALLQDEARAAKVTIRDNCYVDNLLYDGDRVAGVHVKADADSPGEDIPAKLVIGADGINSTIAKLVGAREYNTYDKSQVIYYAYFSGVDIDHVTFFARPGRMGFAWKTNDGMIVAGFCCRIADTARIRSETEETFWEEMGAIAPDLTASLKAGTKETPILSAGTRSFMRTASGPGWALTGDAGINMDPITAAGISNAFIQADMLAETIRKGLSKDNLDHALKAFGQARDAALGPLYEFTAQMAMLDPETPDEIMQLFMALASNQKATDEYFGVFAQTVPVQEFFDPENIGRIISEAQVAQAV